VEKREVGVHLGGKKGTEEGERIVGIELRRRKMTPKEGGGEAHVGESKTTTTQKKKTKKTNLNNKREKEKEERSPITEPKQQPQGFGSAPRQKARRKRRRQQCSRGQRSNPNGSKSMSSLSKKGGKREGLGPRGDTLDKGKERETPGKEQSPHTNRKEMR